MKKILIIIFLIMLILTFYEIGHVYSYYKNQLVGEYKSDLGNWTIKVNNNDLKKTKEPTQFELTDENFHFVSSNFSVANKVAPGKKMKADFIIDPTDTDVSIKYYLEVLLPQDSCLKVENIESYLQQQDGSNPIENEIIEDTLATEGVKRYTGIIPVSKIQEKNVNKISVNVSWKNDEQQNSRDTEIGKKENAKLSIPINMKFEQYMGESIIEKPKDESNNQNIK